MLRISPPPSLNSSKSSSIYQSDNPFRPNRYATLTYSHSFSYSSYLSSSPNCLRSNTAPISFHSPKTSSFNSFKDSFIRPVQQKQQQRQQQSQQTSTTISNSTSTQSINSNSSSSPRRFDPKNIQKIVLEWCQAQTKNYPVCLYFKDMMYL